MQINQIEKEIQTKGIQQTSKHKGLVVITLVLGFVGVTFFAMPIVFSDQYSALVSNYDTEVNTIPKKDTEPKFVATHIDTPNPLKGVYMTSWVAGTPSIRSDIVLMIEESELNAVVIDIKDYTGKVSFDVWDKDLDAIGSEEIRISDLREFIKELHDKNIYVIGRISAFQDPYMVKFLPELAVKRSSDGEVWKDYKGISWIDVGARRVWDYLIAIGREAYNAGFDELNYDYIRFPSDGNMRDIYYPFSEDKILNDTEYGKAKVLEEFFAYLHNQLGDSGAVLSADLFGMTTTNSDDLNIGQVIERALPYFDYISPMVYPSHYPTGFIGIKNPASSPYEVVHYSLKEAVKKIERMKVSSSTPDYIREHLSINQLRPWLQDFDLGAIYTPEMVRKQMQATYDNGLTSWLLWDAANTYTKDALLYK